MIIRLLPIIAAIGVCVVSLLSSQSVNAQTNGSSDAVALRFEKYEEKINAVLLTRFDEEKRFLSDVMQMVREGQLPERLVETSFKWVLNKRPHTKNRFIYFERVLRIQADLLEIELPPFNSEIYNGRVHRQ